MVRRQILLLKSNKQRPSNENINQRLGDPEFAVLTFCMGNVLETLKERCENWERCRFNTRRAWCSEIDRYPVFVPNALIDEEIEFKLIKVKRTLR